MLGDKRFLRSIKLRNILSFGPDTPEVELQSLNVLFGPNGAGKSNLIEAVSLLQAAPANLFEPVRTSGGIGEWLWKGEAPVSMAEIEVTVFYPQGETPLRHRLEFATLGQRAELFGEVIENARPNSPDEPDVESYYRSDNGHSVLNVKTRETPYRARPRRELRRIDLTELAESIVSQRKDPDQYPEVTYLGNEYGKIKLFREWNLGRNTQPRRPQPTDLSGDFLREDAANIALVLNDLEHLSNLRASLV